MSGAVALRRPESAGGRLSLPHDLWSGEATFDDLLSRVWDDLSARGTADCPVCGGATMVARQDAHSKPVVGRCAVCGSTLT